MCNGFHSYICQTGERVACRHIGSCVLVRVEMYDRVRESLSAVWPWDYGQKALNSKHPQSKLHREAFDMVIESVWPAGTETKFFGLEGFPPRPPFHTQRVAASVQWLNDLWVELVTEPKRPFPIVEVQKFLIDRVIIVPFLH